MGGLVDLEDLIDSREVASMLGLSQPNSVATYLRRYPEMPRPVVDLGPGRPRLWRRSAIQTWLVVRRSGVPGHQARQ